MDIICVGFPPYEGDYTKSTVELMRQLARRHRVLYVEYAYTWKDVLLGILGKNTKAPVSRILRLSPALVLHPQARGQSLWVLTPPPMIPTNFSKNEIVYKLLMRWNGWLMKRAIQKATSAIGFETPVVLNAFAPAWGLALHHQLHETKCFYYCYDDIANCPWVHVHGPRLEQRFIPMVDAVIVSSDGLHRSKSALAKQCFTIKNGVNDLFFQPSLSSASSSCIVGYVGSIDSRIDFRLLVEWATLRTDMTLHLVGPVVADKPQVAQWIAKLQALPNVIFQGPKSPEEVVAAMRNWQVGIIPFVKNAQTAAIYPMKINEYLAMGLAVVSTRFAPLDDFEGVVFFTEDSSQNFVSCVDQAIISNGDYQQKQKRQAFARQNTWESRALALEKIIENV